jgi:transposase
MEEITISMKEMSRYEVIRESLEKRIKVAEAAEVLGLSERQVYRIRARVREQGLKGVIHGLKGKSSKRRLADEIRDKIISLYENKYYDFNINHFTEFLEREEGIKVSRETVRKILRQEDKYPRKPRRRPKHRMRREPMPKEGILMQLDTSEHVWIPEMGKEIYLIAIVDDATNRIEAAKIVLSDSTIENMKLLKEFFERRGLPLAIYIDRDSKFKTTRHESLYQKLKGDPYKDTQIARALRELGINMIYADSPQAKGRIERDFQTLQERLIKELRLYKINTVAEANHYLREEFIPRWNKRFARQAREPGSCYRKIPEGIRLDDVLCLKEKRKVYADNTISYKGRIYQIMADEYRASYAKAEVQVYEHLDGGVSIVYKGRKLRYKYIGRKERRSKKDYSLEDLKHDILILQKT